MWPFRKLPDTIVDDLKRIGLSPTSKLYRNLEGSGELPDDGRVYGQHTVTVDGIIIRFYTGDNNELRGIKAISEEDPTRKFIATATSNEPYPITPTVKVKMMSSLCTPETHPSCGFDDTIWPKVERACLDCGAPVTHPHHDHCEDCVCKS